MEQYKIKGTIYEMQLHRELRDGILIFAYLTDRLGTSKSDIGILDDNDKLDWGFISIVRMLYLSDNQKRFPYHLTVKKQPEGEEIKVYFETLEFMQGMKTAANWLGMSLEDVVISFSENGVVKSLVF